MGVGRAALLSWHGERTPAREAALNPKASVGTNKPHGGGGVLGGRDPNPMIFTNPPGFPKFLE